MDLYTKLDIMILVYIFGRLVDLYYDTLYQVAKGSQYYYDIVYVKMYYFRLEDFNFVQYELIYLLNDWSTS